MSFDSVLRTSSKKAVSTLLFRKSGVFLTISLTLVISLSSLGNAEVGNTNTSSTINQTTDTDGDGLTDILEETLGTDKNNKLGDKDNDGLYDFEEVLDIYGSDNTDNPKYNYNDSASYGSVLDIYSYFNLSSNKTDYLRDQNFTEPNGGFTDYLLWNVNFTGEYSGGNYFSFFGSVSYSNNIMKDVSFTGDNSGGGLGGVIYSNNTMTNVSFTGEKSGGGSDSVVSYSNNTMSDVSFTGKGSGGSFIGSVSYSNNTMSDVSFTGDYAGESFSGDVGYSHNTMTNVSFTGYSSGGSSRGVVSYSNNTMSDVSFTGNYSGGSSRGVVSYNNNTMSDVSFTGNYSGGSRYGGVSYANNNISNILINGYNTSKSQNGTSSYTDNVVVNDSYDTDSDGLGDGYELFESGTDPRLDDTDSDGLADGWEVRYHGSFGVDPILAANDTELSSDVDSDNLNLLEEAIANTDPENADNLTNSTDSAVSFVGISVLRPFALLVTLDLFTSFGIILVAYYLKKKMH